jgi:hypothetical protein
MTILGTFSKMLDKGPTAKAIGPDFGNPPAAGPVISSFSPANAAESPVSPGEKRQGFLYSESLSGVMMEHGDIGAETVAQEASP